MPGRLILTTPLEALCTQHGAVTDLPAQGPRHNIAPGQDIVVLTPDRQLVAMRWGIVPVGRVNARGRPVMEVIVNARSETLFEKSAFAGTGRAVVPADGWYEWTGQKRRKTAWRIGAADGACLSFAAITDRWTAPDGRVLSQVAVVTQAPNADVAPVHDRMGVLLDGGGVAAWLDGDEERARTVFRPWPEGRLTVAEAGAVDWSAP
ncbi:SOS response-associated peptidase [Frigidibacter sp. ROC022]|uniref:SOS response-associated peptidase n=1 Tax=Frigidibacter sp. ROC022 TaxID=2971796 RepID=UPI00215B0F96|nr:SOS response-associated peptidase [Frigidibacter sp. ROC022]MCR8725832.1 SOS response-associated peptidase [Frigidibacter sp. ROC022]